MTALEREQRDRLLSLLIDLDCWLNAHGETLAPIRTLPTVRERVRMALEDHGWLKKQEEVASLEQK
jgi:hypothetical protein